MRTCNFGIVLLVLIMAGVAVGNSPVLATDPCVVKLSSFATMAQNYAYYNSNIGVILPISVTCSFVGGQLYAVADTIDASTNTRLDSANTVLVTAYGTNIYTGQLAFTVPREVVGHTLQMSVTVYSGVFGSYSTGPVLATAVGTVQVNPNNYVNYASCAYNNSCNQIYNYCTLSPSNPGTTQCVGYLYQDPNGCVELAISVYSTYGFVSYQYYTLQKLPASYPAIGSMVTVTGQLYQGSNFAPNGAGCPGNYINVSSISS